MRQTAQHRVEVRDQVGTSGRPLTAAEREVILRLCAVLPGGARGLTDQLQDVRVTDVLGWVDGLTAHSVVVTGDRRRRGARALPVRGFTVDEGGVALGEVVVWVTSSGLAGMRHRALRSDAALPDLDASMTDAVPWPAD